MWQIWVDTGGTFTDCLGISPEGERRQVKILSNSSMRASIRLLGTNNWQLTADWDAPDGFAEGWNIRSLPAGGVVRIERWKRTGKGQFRLDCKEKTLVEGPVEILCPDEPPVLGARLLTGTAARENLPPVRLRLATTRATNALLEGKIARTVLITNRGLGDLPLIGNQQRDDLFAHPRNPRSLLQGVVEISLRQDRSGCRVIDWSDAERAELCGRVGDLTPEAVAVSLLHAYVDPRGEEEVADLLKEQGFPFISRGAALAPLIKMLPRTETAIVDACLQPVMKTYLDQVEGALGEGELLVMNSAGGLVPRNRFHPKDSLLSGPAGGVIGAMRAARQAGFTEGIGFDMGGTSTDVTRWQGRPPLVNETTIGNARVLAPALRIETVAAGGGSICRFDGERLRVGPESAGASPGPACYGAGGPLTLTDVHLLLGRMETSDFGIPVYPQAAREALERIGAELSEAGQPMAPEALLEGFLSLANETMAGAIRKVTLQEGYDAGEYPLVAFGGAGGLHACALAEKLGIKTVLFPPEAGLLSAAGLGAAVPEVIVQRQILRPFNEVRDELAAVFADLANEAAREAGETTGWSIRERVVALKPAGQETEIEVSGESDAATMEEEFNVGYERIFGDRPVAGRALEVVRVRLILAAAEKPLAGETFPPDDRDALHRSRWSLDALPCGEILAGPALLQNRTCSFYLEAGWRAAVGNCGTLRVVRDTGQEENPGHETAAEGKHEALRLALFTQRFTHIAREMGEQLRRTALSTNIKERLDFSCALVDSDGHLIVNAPHVPVHLGSLGLCVREVSRNRHWRPGQVVVTNDPRFGGSHLPDLTVITPVFLDPQRLLGFVVNRAHHAEMGGMTPGSMPPEAVDLSEEGVRITPFLLRADDHDGWSELADLLSSGPWPSRAVEENLIDLRAQVAANQRGARLWQELANRVGVETVLYYGRELRRLARQRVIELLRGKVRQLLTATQYLDDGSPLAVSWSPSGKDRWKVDFSGTGAVHPGNSNATPGIVRSALLYVLCRMIGDDFPLNEGLLEVLDIELPENMLNPSVRPDGSHPAVVAGNVETSQRLVDTMLLLFGEEACSQGTMNNFVFGGDGFRLYETIGGGCGARADQSGASGRHSHMTNTAITDPEILEYRYPVRLTTFALRRGSGGNGKFAGGDGLCREICFLKPVTVSLLTEHRESAPYGLAGGEPGACGGNWLRRADGTLEELPGRVQVELAPGESIRIETPGGGGYGEIRSR